MPLGVAAIGLDHGHIVQMTKGMLGAGATLKAVVAPDPSQIQAFQQQFPMAINRDLAAVLDDPGIQLVLIAAVPQQRAGLICQAMSHGKHVLVAKSPATNLTDLARIRAHMAQAPDLVCGIFFCERLTNPGMLAATALVGHGAIGTVRHITGMGPHRLSRQQRPPWFFQRSLAGGILGDLGSHQTEAFLALTHNQHARIVHAATLPMENADQDSSGIMTLVGDNGAHGQHRVDWLSPTGLPTWGDGRTFVTGTTGTIEIRSIIDVDGHGLGSHVLLVNEQGIQRWTCVAAGTDARSLDTTPVTVSFFHDFLQDIHHKTRIAQDPQITWHAAELALMAQDLADQNPVTATSR